MSTPTDLSGLGLTRRELGAMGIATSALSVLTGGKAIAASSGPFDVAIIGAGTAGISAARTCRANKLTYVMIEARNRLGGRSTCDNSLAVPADLGGEWFQMITPNASGTGTNNPMFDLAVAYSQQSPRYANQLNLQPDIFDRGYYRNGRKVSLNNPDAQAAALAVVEADEIANDAGEAAAKGTASDISAAQALKNADFDSEPWSTLGGATLAAGHGAKLEELGVLDLFHLSQYGPTPEIPTPFCWLTEYGMGNFIANYLGKGVSVRLNTVATKIDWSRKSGVSIETNAGTIKAKTVIVTIPVTVLAKSGPEFFSPALPPAYTEAFAGLPLGAVEKIALQFDSNIFTDLKGSNSENSFVSALTNDGVVRGVQARLWNKNIGVALVGGAEAQYLAKKGPAALRDYGLTTMKKMFGGNPENHLTGHASSAWWTDPYSLGSYSYAPPGKVPLRRTLGHPVAGRIFFAGEAVSVGQHSSLPGAWITGEKAALAAGVAIKKSAAAAEAMTTG